MSTPAKGLSQSAAVKLSGRQSVEPRDQEGQDDFILPFLLQEQNRQLSGPMRAQDENSFDISGSAGSGN